MARRDGFGKSRAGPSRAGEGDEAVNLAALRGKRAEQEAPAQAGDEPLVGILLVMAAGLMFSVSDATAKFLTGALPPIEIAWIRYLVFGAIATAAVARDDWTFRVRRPWLQLVRGLGVVLSALAFMQGLKFLPIAEATAVNFVSPAFITVLSIVFLSEVAGVRRWTALVVGLLGVLIVVRPGSSAAQPAVMLPVLSSAFWASAIVATRKMGGADHVATTLMWSAVSGLVLLTLMLPFVAVRPTVGQVALSLLIGVVSTAGQGLIILAYQKGPASLLAPFSYFQLVTSSIAGWLVFHNVPDVWVVVGGAVIIASGIYTAHRERVRAKERRGLEAQKR